jgi:hypothetical protein
MEKGWFNTSVIMWYLGMGIGRSKWKTIRKYPFLLLIRTLILSLNIRLRPLLFLSRLLWSYIFGLLQMGLIYWDCKISKGMKPKSRFLLDGKPLNWLFQPIKDLLIGGRSNINGIQNQLLLKNHRNRLKIIWRCPC